MIIKCKVCNGSGSASIDVLFSMKRKVCPACNGAGEFEINIPSDRMIACKICHGRGAIHTDSLVSNQRKICPACKGIGLIERPVIGTMKEVTNEVILPKAPRLSHYEFDVAVSFAGEDREIVKQYVDTISPRGLKVFYDKYEQVGLWGKDLYDKLDEVYRTKAMCCVIFISIHYAEKVWTNHERKSAQARALKENIEYILPVRLDDTEIPGIPPTIGYLDLRSMTVAELAYKTIEKVNILKTRHS